MYWRLALVGVLAACSFSSRLGGDAAVDAPPDTSDATLAPFGPPMSIAELDSPEVNDDPTLTADLLEICFSSQRPGGSGMDDVWCATRATASAAWSPPAPVPQLNSGAKETSVEFAPDGLTIYVMSDRVTNNNDIWVATRTDRAELWSPPMLIMELSSPASDFALGVTGDNCEIIISADRGGPGGVDLWSARRATAFDPWPATQMSVTISHTSDDTDPWLSADGKTIFYSSKRGGGNLDFWTATRGDRDAPFDPPTPVTELNTAATETDIWLSPDLRTAVFAVGGELLVATR